MTAAEARRFADAHRLPDEPEPPLPPPELLTLLTLLGFPGRQLGRGPEACVVRRGGGPRGADAHDRPEMGDVA